MRNAATSSRLPGVYFQAEPSPPAEVLPRMDIAAFVGLAASGPIHLPVAVEDAVRFRDLFGEDLPLAWDSELGQVQQAYLGQAVEAFFRNGGRRCWVVRVADGAVENRFQLPGLVRGDTLNPALARARSEGSWSDPLRVGTVLQREPFAVASIAVVAAAYQVDLRAAPGAVVVNDLLELSFGDAGMLLYLLVSKVSSTGGLQRVEARSAWWFVQEESSSPPPVATSAELLGADGPVALAVREVVIEGREVALEIDAGGAVPAPGDLVRIGFDSGRTLLLPVESLEPDVAGSPPEPFYRVRGSEGLWPIDGTEGVTRLSAWNNSSPPTAGLALASRLTFEILVWKGEEVSGRLSGLGLTGAHPRFWANLPVDADLFRWNGAGVVRTLSALEEEAARPRFALGGEENPAAVYLPIGMAGAPGLERTLGPVGAPTPDTALERDGVAGYSADLFYDADLAGVRTDAVIEEGNHKLYLREPGQLPRGLHSLLPVEEVTLLSVPDAVHRGWSKEPPVTQSLLVLLDAPTLEPIGPVDSAGRYEVAWSAVEAAAKYQLEECEEPTFQLPVVRYEGTERSSRVPVRSHCPAVLYYRVRVVKGTEVSPWSNTERVVRPEPDFQRCGFVPLEAPDQEIPVVTTPGGRQYLLSWSEVAEATGYTLEEANDPAFLTATVIYSGEEPAWVVDRSRDGVTWYRVRAERGGEHGPWSVTRMITAWEPVWTVAPKRSSQAGLLAVHRTLMRFCAARGDLTAVLSLPASFRERETLAHVAALTPSEADDDVVLEPEASEDLTEGEVLVPPLSYGEARALSYAAIYHPWTWVRTVAGTIVLVPPEGTVVGSMAGSAIGRGAWTAPANDLLRGVVALEPVIPKGARLTLYNAQVNLLQRDPRGFLVLSADTLSDETDWRPWNVRRLMILLRRLALREGMTYVFRPNNEIFRQFVRHRFEQLLRDLYTRGAFAGESPSSAFRVGVDASVNPPASVEQGRLIIELRVAPSRPLAFLTVKLLQAGSEALTVLEG